jgi:hypothetical protein
MHVRDIDVALLDDEAMDEHAASAALLLDMVKCYEQVSLQYLCIFAILWGVELTPFRLVVQEFSHQRVIVLVQAVSKAVSANFGIVAGSRFLEQGSKDLLVGAYGHCSGKIPSLHVDHVR